MELFWRLILLLLLGLVTRFYVLRWALFSANNLGSWSSHFPSLPLKCLVKPSISFGFVLLIMLHLRILQKNGVLVLLNNFSGKIGRKVVLVQQRLGLGDCLRFNASSEVPYSGMIVNTVIQILGLLSVINSSQLLRIFLTLFEWIS